MKYTKLCFSFLILTLTGFSAFSQTTSWKGTASTSWKNSSNWTNGVPSSTKDVVIGDANFTGSYQPAISSSATAKSLIIGGGTKASTLTVNRGLTVAGNITINSNGTISNGAYTITLTGNWIKDGTYTTTSSSAKVTFAGTNQVIGGSSATTFRRLSINAGSTVTLSSNLTLSGTSSILTLSGTLNPGESPTYTVTATGSADLTVNANGVLHVKAATFADNYAIAGTTTLSSGSIVEYSSTTTAQTVSNSFTYSTLRISGSGTKSLAGNLPSLRSTASSYGNIYINAGTFDLQTYTANRGIFSTGGTFSVANGATLKIGGMNSFPTGYNTRSFGLTSTVEYSGTAQTVSEQAYGNLTLSSSSGSVVKLMPMASMIIAGNLTSNIGAGTGVSYTAGGALTINGNMVIGTGTTFNGGLLSHIVTGSWINNGTLSSSGTITMNGPATSISGSGTHNFNNLTINASGVTCSASAISVAGNLVTTGAGSFTHTSGTLTMSGTSKTITGTGVSLENLTVSGTVSTSSTLAISGNLSVSGSLTSSAGVIIMSGTSKTITGSGTKSFYALTVSGSITTAVNFTVTSGLNVSGTFSASSNSVATFTGSSTLSGTANLYNVTINGTELKLSTNAVLGIANAFTVTAGSLNVVSATPNTVSFNGTGAQNINGLTYHNLQIANGNTKAAAAAVTVNGNLTIESTTTFSAGSFTHSIYGNWVNSGTFTQGTSTVQFAGTSNSTISGVTTFNTLTVNKSSASNGVTLLNNVNVPTLNITTGWMNTGSNTVNITSARNGNGYIFGNIQRTHSFSGSTAYAFEGPNNTITFSGANSVTSITVNVTQGAISDFPFSGSVSRVYTITLTGSIGAATATLRLHYEDAELNGNNESSAQLWRYNGSTWSVSGKTGNNTTTNYIERSGITDLSNRWTLSDDANVVRWNGSVSSSWSTAGNWTVLQGSGSTPPASGDIVQLGTTAFTNQPMISSAVNIKNVIFGSSQAVTLTLAPGGSITTNAINGTWSSNATHTIDVGAQSLAVNGDLTLSDGTNAHTINLNIGSGSVNVTGSLTESGNSAITFSGSGTLTIGQNFIYSGGVFTPSTGTVVYNGTLLQAVGGVSYNHLTINKSSGIANIASPVTVNGNLTVSAGELDINAASVISGHVTIASGAVLNGDGVTTSVGGNWSNSGTFVSATGTILMNGVSSQSVSATTFNNLSVNKTSGTVTLGGNVVANGNISVIAGTLDMAGYTAVRNELGGVFTLSGTSSLLLSGSNNFPSGFATYSFDTMSTVQYYGTGSQTVSGVNYGHLSLINGGSNEKTLGASVGVKGNLTIASGAILNAGSYTITLGGNWSNSGTFTSSTSTVVFGGNAKTLAGNTTFYRMTITGSYSATNDVTINNRFFVTSTGSYAAGSGTHIVHGDLTNSGVLTSTGVTTFSGTSTQTIQLLNAITSNSAGVINFNGSVPPILNSNTMPTYANLNINNTGGVTASVGWKVLVSFTIGSGATFNAGSHTDTISGSFTNNGTVTSSGTLFFNPSTGSPVIAFGSALTSTGTIIFGGSAPLNITGTPAAMNDVVITNSNGAGITPPSGWTIGGSLTIGNNSMFNAGSYSYTVAENLESNGTLNGGTSTFTMSGTGELSGNSMTTFNNLIITGDVTASSDFNVSGNFTNNGIFDATIGTLIMTGSGASVITGSPSPVSIAQIQISKTNATVSLGANLTGIASLEISSGTLNATTYSLTQNAGTLTIGSGGTLQVGGTTTLPAFDIYDLDTFSTVEYNGSGTQAVSGTVVYGNLTFSGSGTKTVNTGLTVSNDFTMSSGTFTGGAYTHTIGGDWTVSGGTYNSTGTIILFSGNAAQTIKSTVQFNGITINKSSGALYDSTDVTVNGTLTLTNGNVITGPRKQIVSSSGSIARTNGYVIGNLQKHVPVGASTITFETGDANGYAPVSVSFATVSGAGNLIASTTTGDHSDIAKSQLNAARSVNRYWSLTNSGITFTSYNITLTFLTGDVDAAANTASLHIAKYGTGSWQVPAVGSRTSTTTRATGLTDMGDFIVAELSARVWDGGAGTPAWSDAANWNPDGVPSTTEDGWVKTPVNIQVSGAVNAGGLLLDHASAAVVLQTGSSFTLSGIVTLTNGELRINGQSLTLNGTLSSTGTGIIKGAAGSSLTIGGNTGGDFGTVKMGTSSAADNQLESFTLNRSGVGGSVSIGSNGMQVTSVVTITNGTLNTGGNLTLVSNQSGTARIASVNLAQADIIGNVTVQRYIPAVVRRSRMLSSPVSNFNFSQFSDDIFVTGPGGVTNGFDASPTNSSTIYTYQESTGGSGRGWKAISNISNTLTGGQGALVFIRGDRTLTAPFVAPFPAQNAVTIDYVSQPVNKGNISPEVSYTNTGSVSDDGWNMLGNPYPSPINWNSINKTNLSVFYYTLNPATGSYVADDGSNTIASGQAFLVQAIAGSPSLTFTENCKSATTPVSYFKTAGASITAKMIRDSVNADMLKLVFSPGSDINYIQNEDAIKFTNSVVNFGTAVNHDSVLLQFNRTPLPSNGSDTFRLYVNAATGTYTLNFSGVQSLGTSYGVSLYDAFTGTTTDLNTQTDYVFSITSNSLSKGYNRFKLIISTSSLPVTLAGFTAEKKGGDVLLKWFTAQEKNSSHFVVERLSGSEWIQAGTVRSKGNSTAVTGYVFTDQGAFSTNADVLYYRLRQVDQDGEATLSNTVTVNNESSLTNVSITLYPNPATDHIIIRTESNTMIGAVVIYDLTGRNVMAVTGGKENIKLDVASLEKGVYMAEISGHESGSVMQVIKFVIQ